MVYQPGGINVDLLTHSILTGKFIGKQPGIILCGSLAPDLPFYLLYPAWVAGKGVLRESVKNNDWRIVTRKLTDWPEPPHWIAMLHHVFHSIPVVTLGALIIRLVAGHWLGRAYAAWLLHIAVDIPTHSRKQWGPKFLWPFSGFAADGVSWVEVGLGMITRLKQGINNGKTQSKI